MLEGCDEVRSSEALKPKESINILGIPLDHGDVATLPTHLFATDHVYLIFSTTCQRVRTRWPVHTRPNATSACASVASAVCMRASASRSSRSSITENVRVVYDLLFAFNPSRTLIFCNSKHAMKELDTFLYNKRPSHDLNPRKLQSNRGRRC